MKILVYCGLWLLHAISETSSFCESHFAIKNASYGFNDFIYEGSLSDCACSDTNICVRKCCAPNYYINGSKCIFNDTIEFKVDVYNNSVLQDYSSNVRVISGILKCQTVDYFMLDPNAETDKFYLQNDGRLWKPALKTYVNLDQYCLDYFEGDGNSGLECFPKVHNNNLNFIGMIISLPFLLITFIVYGLLPGRNLQAKCLMCFVITLFGAYLCLVIIKNNVSVSRGSCVTLALFCYFCFMACFFWMNVMSIDIWWTFSGFRDFSGNKKEVERKRFSLYSIYAWGVPLILLIIVASLINTLETDEWYNPGIGITRCWFKSTFTSLFYFHGPFSIIILVNIILFIITAIKIKQLHKDAAVLRNADSKTHNESDKQNFKLFARLLLVMGLNWTMEVISFAVEWGVGQVPPAVWYVTDFCNAIYGVVLFFLFVFKKKIWKELKARYYSFTKNNKNNRNNKNRKAKESPCTTEVPLSNL